MGAGKYNGEIFGSHTPTSVQTGGGEIIPNHREKTSRGSLTPPHPIASVTAAPQYERREKTRWNKGSICKPRLSLPGGTPAYDLYSFPSGQGKKWVQGMWEDGFVSSFWSPGSWVLSKTFARSSCAFG
jgi:hypothetical protein